MHSTTSRCSGGSVRPAHHHDAGGLAPERVEPWDVEGLDVVHRGEERLAVEAQDVAEGEAGQAHGEPELAVPAQAGRVQPKKRVRRPDDLVLPDGSTRASTMRTTSSSNGSATVNTISSFHVMLLAAGR
jgi:hypothetical protein